MNTRWLWFDFVPPELGLGRAERRAVNRRADELRPKGLGNQAHRRSLRIYVLAASPAGALFIAMPIAEYWHWHPPPIAKMCIVVSMFISLWVAGAYARAKTHMPYICRALREMGHDVCPECGYLLQGLGEEIARCPECGSIRERASPPGR